MSPFIDNNILLSTCGFGGNLVQTPNDGKLIDLYTQQTYIDNINGCIKRRRVFILLSAKDFFVLLFFLLETVLDSFANTKTVSFFSSFHESRRMQYVIYSIYLHIILCSCIRVRESLIRFSTFQIRPFVRKGNRFNGDLFFFFYRDIFKLQVYIMVVFCNTYNAIIYGSLTCSVFDIHNVLSIIPLRIVSNVLSLHHS